MAVESYQGLHSLGIGEPVPGAPAQDLCQEVFTGCSGLPLAPTGLVPCGSLPGHPMSRTETSRGTCLPLGSSGKWSKSPERQENLEQRGPERSRRQEQSVPSGFLLTPLFHTHLFIEQTSTEVQHAPGTNLEPEDPRGASSHCAPQGVAAYSTQRQGGPSESVPTATPFPTPPF